MFIKMQMSQQRFDRVSWGDFDARPRISGRPTFNLDRPGESACHLFWKLFYVARQREKLSEFHLFSPPSAN